MEPVQNRVVEPAPSVVDNHFGLSTKSAVQVSGISLMPMYLLQEKGKFDL